MKKPDLFSKKAAEILADRAVKLGDFEELYENFARRLTLFLGQDITPAQSARIILEMKLSRCDVGGYDQDHVLDAANYLFIFGALKECENEPD